ncbi:MAG: 50S ribosomal protein L3 [Legionellales bacterium]|nr:50S ribosomal protein L3 [Legionellales bacterium]
MSLGLVGRKCGMSRKFLEDGTSVPVSLIEVLPNRVTQIKNLDKDGYVAVQVTTGNQLASRINKPLAGHYSKAESGLGRGIWEFRVENDFKFKDKSLDEIELGTEITLEIFEEGQIVDVSGISKGKGFAGTVKRHNFATQDATHGNSLAHRAPGSIGQNQTPGRVFKGKKMAGHMGAEKKTIQNLRVVEVNQEKNLLVIKGAVPGFASGTVIIKPAVKKTKVKK